MPKKRSRKKLIENLDTVFSQYIRLRDADQEGYCRCVTCGEKHYWKRIQAGHFISRKHYATRWDETNVHAQCVACNVFRAGEQYKYSLFLGADISHELLEKSRELVKYADFELEEMIKNYKNKIKYMEVH